MPTENRSSNTELISLAASAIEDLMANGTGAVAAAAWSDLPAQLRKINLAPAQQHQGEPVAWLHGSPKGKSLSFSEAAHENVDSTPLYTHADPGEVERLRLLVQAGQEVEDHLSKQIDIAEITIQGLRTQLANLNALLRDIKDEGATWPLRKSLVSRLETALANGAVLSASAEPSAPKSCGACGGCANGCQLDKDSPSAPVELDERAAFEQAFVVQDGVFFSPDRKEYRSMNGRSIEETDAIDLNLRLSGWKARAALERKP